MSKNRNQSGISQPDATLLAIVSPGFQSEAESFDLAHLDDFASWIEKELLSLEHRFAAYCTHNSLRQSGGR